MAAGSVAATIIVLASRDTTPANAEPAVSVTRSSFFTIGDARRLRHELESTQGELNILRAQLERADQILLFSTRYGITGTMATNVFDASVREGIDPELAFRLVRLESEFNTKAISSVGAIGLTQLMPSTAKDIERGTTREQLFEPKTNLRIGFRYLRRLLELHRGDVRLAVLSYNRGEDAVFRDVRAGVNPNNGYERSVLKGYTGKGTID